MDKQDGQDFCLFCSGFYIMSILSIHVNKGRRLTNLIVERIGSAANFPRS